jgi:hypothetical protein
MISSYRERWRDWPFETSATGSLEHCANSNKHSCLKDEKRVNKLSSFEERFFLSTKPTKPIGNLLLL